MKKYLLFVMGFVCVSIGMRAQNPPTTQTNGSVVTIYSNDFPDLEGIESFGNFWYEWAFNGKTTLEVVGDLSQTGIDHLNSLLPTKTYVTPIKLDLSQATLTTALTGLPTKNIVDRCVLPPNTQIPAPVSEDMKYVISNGDPAYIYVAEGVTLSQINDDLNLSGNPDIYLYGDGAPSLKTELESQGYTKVHAAASYDGPLELTVAAPLSDAALEAALAAMADAPEGAKVKKVTVLHVTGALSNADVDYIKNLSMLQLLDLSGATATKEQVAACVKEGDYNAKDIALIIPTPQTNDYTTGMSDIYYYQTCCGSGNGLKNISFYEMVEEDGVLTQTNNLKVWGANSTLAKLKLAQSPQMINNTMGISFLPNYTANGDVNWTHGDNSVYPVAESGFVANTLSQLDCLSIDMMWLEHGNLKYDFSALNPETHYIVIPNNVSGYRTDSDIDDRVSGTDYKYNNNIWVVSSYAGTAHPYSAGIAFKGGDCILTQNPQIDAEFAVTTNVTYIREAGKLSGAAATLNQFQKNATRAIIFGEADNTDLDAMQYVGSTKVDLSKLDLVEGTSYTSYQNDAVQYLALPDNGAVGDFVPSALKDNCPALLGVGLYKEATTEYLAENEIDNKLYYASWLAGGVRTIMNMLPEAQNTGYNEGTTRVGLRSYKMWGPLNAADISNKSAYLTADGHVGSGYELNEKGEYETVAIPGASASGSTYGLLGGSSTQIYDADLSMAWFPNQDDMNFNAASAYGTTTFVSCELPRTHMTTIPAHAFNNMQALHYIGIPNIYTTIKGYAFYLTGNATVGDGSGVGPFQIDTYQVQKGEGVDPYSCTADDALIVETISNGPLTVTLPESLGNNTGEGLYTGSMQYSTRVKDVYVMADPAPICQIDAFGSVAYVGNNTYGGVKAHPFARDKYRMGVATYTEETENQWISVLHFPASTVKNGQNKNYTDPTREYCLYDETGAVDGNGMPVVWPNQSEMLRSYNQAVTGVTWNAWEKQRVEDPGYNNYNEFANETGEGKYNQSTPDFNIDATLTYNKTNYCGWHQFVLASTWLPIPDIDEEEEVNYVKLDWFTFCIPYNMTKKQVIELLGVPKSDDRVTRKLDGVAQYDDVLPDVRTLVGVTRYPYISQIILHLSQNIVAKSTDLEVGYREPDYSVTRGFAKDENFNELTGEENEIYIKGGYPYLIRAYVPEELANDVTNLGGFTLMRGTFGPENAGYKHTCSNDYEGVAPYEQKVQAYLNTYGRLLYDSDGKPIPERDSNGEIVKDSKGKIVYKIDPNVEEYLVYFDDTKDETASIEDTPDKERYIYTFVGQFWKQKLPLYSYYLGNNTNPSPDAVTKKKFYRATSALDGSDKFSIWDWNPYVSIITANADKIVNEPHQKATGQYTSSLTMDFNGYNDDFGYIKQPNSSTPNGGNDAKYIFVFDDGIDEDINGGETTSIGYFNNIPVLPSNGKIYNMNGQNVGTSVVGLQKGLYIVNGKKFIVK